MIAHLPGGPLALVAATTLLLAPAALVGAFPGRTRRSRRRAALTAAGFATLAVAISSPIETIAERSFSGHMLQHLLILVVAPALLCGGRAMATIAATGGRLGVRSRRGRWLRHLRLRRDGNEAAVLIAATVSHAAVLTFWHLPAMFERAVAEPAVHAVEHATMFAAGVSLFGAWAVLARRAPFGALAASFATAVHGAALGALITFASRPVYAVAAGGTATLGDQQVAGLLMWVPTGVVYTALAMATLWLGPLDAGRALRTGPGAPSARQHPDLDPAVGRQPPLDGAGDVRGGEVVHQDRL